jgi:hypothetical protein
MTLKLNHSKMATFPEGSARQWYTADFSPLLNIHVFDDGDGLWRWRITSLVTIQDFIRGYDTKDAAYQAARAVAAAQAGKIYTALALTLSD